MNRYIDLLPHSICLPINHISSITLTFANVFISTKNPSLSLYHYLVAAELVNAFENLDAAIQIGPDPKSDRVDMVWALWIVPEGSRKSRASANSRYVGSNQFSRCICIPTSTSTLNKLQRHSYRQGLH
jgi:hypothetical protein